MSRRIRFLRRLLILGPGLCALAGGVLILAPWPRALVARIAPLDRIGHVPADPTYRARDGRLLRHDPGTDGIREEWVGLDRCPRALVQAVLAAEDARFPSHPGIDPLAILRAARDNLIHGRVVSGASTITQQLVRIMIPSPRTWSSKLREALQALALEKALSKGEILEQYLNRLPMPGATRGVGQGSWRLFGRPLDQLTAGELAALAGVAQSPGRFDPRRGARARAALDARRDWILGRMEGLAFLDAGTRQAFAGRESRYAPGRPPFRAPHLLSRLEPEDPRTPVRTLLDAGIQERASTLLRSHRARLRKGGCRQGAVLVLDTPTGDVLAWVGSMDWADEDLGYNDGVLARRSAGSTLKPFAYALALERGLTLATPLADVHRSYATPAGDYHPRNFDEQDYGPVTIRTALASSLNAAAVELARRVGTRSIASLFTDLRLLPAGADTASLGVGIVIGNAEVSLLDLTAAYRCLATGGMLGPAAVTPDRRRKARRVLSEETAYMVAHVLTDPAARILSFGAMHVFDFPFPIAVKTGTSTGYRDCWALGFTSRYTVGVWAGNFDGRPTAGLSGSSAAVPLFSDLMLMLHRQGPPPPLARPAGVTSREVCADSGLAPTGACPTRIEELFLARGPEPGPCPRHGADAPGVVRLPAEFAPWLADRQGRGLAGRYRLADAGSPDGGLRIEYPHPGDRFVCSPGPDGGGRVMVRAVPGRLQPYLRWFVNAEEIDSTPPPYRWTWPLSRGHHRIIAATPTMDEAVAVDFTVE